MAWGGGVDGFDGYACACGILQAWPLTGPFLAAAGCRAMDVQACAQVHDYGYAGMLTKSAAAGGRRQERGASAGKGAVAVHLSHRQCKLACCWSLRALRCTGEEGGKGGKGGEGCVREGGCNGWRKSSIYGYSFVMFGGCPPLARMPCQGGIGPWSGCRPLGRGSLLAFSLRT